MDKTAHILKQLLFLIIFISLLVSKQGFSQCDIDFYPTSNPNDSCFIAGNDITLTNTTLVGWNITDTSTGTSVHSDFASPTSTTLWPGSSVLPGTYIIEIYTYTGAFPFWVFLCSDTITIAPGPLYLPDTTLSYCQWNTINLEDSLSTSLINAITPEYVFSIGTVIIDGTDYEINDGITIIDVTVTDVSGCITTAQITINGTPNNINTQTYTISDTVIQHCQTTLVTFSIDNPNTNVFNYSWEVNNDTGIITSTDTIFSTNYTGTQLNPLPNPGSFNVSLTVTDTGGCSVPFNNTIISLGLEFPTGWNLSLVDNLSPACVYDSTDPNSVLIPSIYWLELAPPASLSIPIIEMGPQDTIFWQIFCDSAAHASGNPDVLDAFWVYSDLPSLIIPKPGNPSDSIAALQIPWYKNSCDCEDEFYEIKYFIQPACDGPEPGSRFKAVLDPIEADFIIPTPLCPNEEEIFQNASISGCDSISLNDDEDYIYYNWDFGNCYVKIDTVNPQDPNPFPDVIYAYPEPGIYIVTLTAESYCGETDISDTLTVNQQPNVEITSDSSVCRGQNITFHANVSSEPDTSRDAICLNGDSIHIEVPAGGQIDTSSGYFWDFGDGNTSTNTQPIHKYTNCDKYWVTLTVTDLNGCKRTDSMEVIVFDLPHPSFTSTIVCTPDSSGLIDLSTVSTTAPPDSCFGSPIFEWEWNFGDGSQYIYSGNNPDDTILHSYNPLCDGITDTNYLATLIVTDTNGCIDSTDNPVVVRCEQLADFDPTDFCLLTASGNNNSQIITNESVPLDNTITDTNYVVWYVYDPPGSTSNPTQYNSIDLNHTFTQAGIYSIVMEINGQFCSGRDSSTVEVWENPTSSTIGSDVLCFGDATGSVDLTVSGGTNPYTYLWIPIGDTTQDLDSILAGTYSVTVTDSNGCTDTISISLTEPANPISLSITGVLFLIIPDFSVAISSIVFPKREV